MCNVRTFREFHANVAIPAIYAYILPNEKYRKYRVEVKKRYLRGVLLLVVVGHFWDPSS